MNRIYCLIIFIIFSNTLQAQVSLIGNTSYSNSNSQALQSLDSSGAETAAIKSMIMNNPKVLVLSASDTGLRTLADTTSKHTGCVIAFLGCDETHDVISDFVNYFYTECRTTNNTEVAFYNAKIYLFKKHPDSPVTPILRCKN